MATHAARTLLARSLAGASQIVRRETGMSRVLRQPASAATRGFHASSVSRHAKKHPPGDGFKVTFITPEGDSFDCYAHQDETLLDVAHANDIEMEGACEGSCACSTCHVIVEPEYYDKLEEPSDEENDMLDLAFGLEETSRLGCQIKMEKGLDGITVRLPSATRNMAVDGFKPKPH